VLHFKDAWFDRDAKAGKTEADAVMEYQGKRWWVEIDNSGKMSSKKQMKAKWNKYAGVEGVILVVCRTERRMFRLLLEGEQVRDQALFTTFDRLRDGKPWVDFDGGRIVL
jgi:hypothetical protein